METPLSSDARSAVETLTFQRTQLQDWIARLGAVGSEVPPHVRERVHRDYEGRLDAVTRQLAEHRDSLAAELEDRRMELEDADARRAAAADDLEEARLRHLIGELEDGAWEVRRPELETALAAVESEAGGIRAEVERLDALLRDIAEPVEEPAPPAPESEPAAPQEEPAVAFPFRDTSDDTVPEFTPYATAAVGAGDDDLGVDLSWLDEVEQGASRSVGGGTLATGEEAAPSADDLAFLEELDRAISSSPQAVDEAGKAAPAGGDDRTLDPDRAGMLLCKECGAINEPQLWYCEICGSEL